MAKTRMSVHIEPTELVALFAALGFRVTFYVDDQGVLTAYGHCLHSQVALEAWAHLTHDRGIGAADIMGYPDVGAVKIKERRPEEGQPQVTNSARPGRLLYDGPLQEVYVICDGPPAPESGRFVEVETPDGKGVGVGEWDRREDGLWRLGPFLVKASAVR